MEKRNLPRLDDDLEELNNLKNLQKIKFCVTGCGDGNFINRIKNAKNRFALDINIYNSNFLRKKVSSL